MESGSGHYFLLSASTPKPTVAIRFIVLFDLLDKWPLQWSPYERVCALCLESFKSKCHWKDPSIPRSVSTGQPGLRVPAPAAALGDRQAAGRRPGDAAQPRRPSGRRPGVPLHPFCKHHSPHTAATQAGRGAAAPRRSVTTFILFLG